MLHRGQTERAGAESVQLWDRRCRVLALDFFFLGACMVLSAPGSRGQWA